MSVNNRDATSLWEILRAVELIQAFTTNMSYGSYLEDDLVQSAVERKFEIMGEAARRFSDEFRQAHPEIDWRSLIGLRNIISHRYDQVDHALLWDSIETVLPILLEQIKTLLPPISEVEEL